MRKLFFLFFLLCPVSANAYTLEQLLPAIARYEAFSQKFTETRYMAVVQEPLTVNGTLSFTPPDHIEKTVTSPIEEQLIIERGTITLRKKDAKSYSTQTIAVSQHPVLSALFASLQGTISGDAALLKQAFTATVSGTKSAWELNLVPRTAEAQKFLQWIRISGNGKFVKTIEVLETSKERSVMQLRRE